VVGGVVVLQEEARRTFRETKVASSLSKGVASKYQFLFLRRNSFPIFKTNPPQKAVSLLAKSKTSFASR